MGKGNTSSQKSGSGVRRSFRKLNKGLKSLFYTVLVGTVGVISFSRIFLVPNITINWDAPILIDGSYRLYLGQTIHNDFSSPVGLLNLFPGAVGMKIFGPNLLGLNFGISLFSFILTLILIQFSLGILNRKATYLLAITISVFFSSPATLSIKDYFSYTSAYNPVAYGLLTFICVVLLSFYFLPDNRRDVLTLRFSVGIGFALGILVLVKFPIALISLFPIALYILFSARNRKVLLVGIVTSFGATLISFLVAFRISINAMWRDFWIVMSSRQDLIAETTMQTEKYFMNSSKFAWLAILFLYLALVFKYGTPIRFLVIFCATIVIDFAVQSTIQQPPELVLPLVLSIPFVGGHYTRHKTSNVLTSAVTILLIFPVILLNYGNGFYYVSTAVSKILEVRSIQAAQDQKIVTVYSTDSVFESALTGRITADTKLLTVGCNDLYSINNRLKHARYVPLYWHKGVTFSEASLRQMEYFNPNTIFKEVNLVGVSYSCPHGDSAKVFERFYLEYLEANFKIFAKVDQYTIWEKNTLEIPK